MTINSSSTSNQTPPPVAGEIGDAELFRVLEQIYIVAGFVRPLDLRGLLSRLAHGRRLGPLIDKTVGEISDIDYGKLVTAAKKLEEFQTWSRFLPEREP